MSTITFLLSSDPVTLAARAPDATVEAEYGDTVVEGSLLTMAHHGPRKGQKAPCAYTAGECAELHSPFTERGEIEVGLSHVDLDTIGGCMAILGFKPGPAAFWALAEFVDLNGAHKLLAWDVVGAFSLTEKAEAVEMLYAWWAWNTKVENRVYPARDGSVTDVTERVEAAANAILQITAGNRAFLAEGLKFEIQEEQLNVDSYRSFNGGVVLRKASRFVNHLYALPSVVASSGLEVERVIAQACVAYNDETGEVTVSYADGVPSGAKTCREIVQTLWGALAGGHDGIAGSPRGQRLTMDDAAVAAVMVEVELARSAAV